MKVLVTGGTGFVGKKVVNALLSQKHEVWVLSRSNKKVQKEFAEAVKTIVWNDQSLTDSTDLAEIEGVINLMGENISSKRWSEEQKKIIMDSRVRGTRILLDYFSKRTKPLNVFVSASAIGVYKNSVGDETLDEETALGTGFLSDVCQSWEKVVHESKSEKILRKVIVRIGVVLGREGGALEKLLPIFKLGGGGPIGNGRQWMSWIHVDDLAQLLVTALENSKYAGVYNGVAPEPVTNLIFSKTLASVLSRPCLLPVPAFVMKLVMGEMSCIVLDSQRIKPTKTIANGFKFKFHDLRSAFKNITQS